VLPLSYSRIASSFWGSSGANWHSALASANFGAYSSALARSRRQRRPCAGLRGIASQAGTLEKTIQLVKYDLATQQKPETRRMKPGFDEARGACNGYIGRETNRKRHLAEPKAVKSCTDNEFRPKWRQMAHRFEGGEPKLAKTNVFSDMLQKIRSEFNHRKCERSSKLRIRRKLDTPHFTHQ
jgi:hypothetical protein